jgi:hypothetical protein
MKHIVDFINEAVVKPFLYVQSYSTNPPLAFDLAGINYDRIDVSLDNVLDFSPKFLKWYESNKDNLYNLVIYRGGKRYDFFAVVGTKEMGDSGYPVFADMLTSSDLEDWLKKNGKATSTKVGKS